MKVDNYIIKLYKNKNFLYYVYHYDSVGKDINYAEKYFELKNAIRIGDEITERIFKKYEKYTISKHTYDHLKEDFFKNISKKELNFKVINYAMENRLLKLKKITDNINER